MSNIKEKRKEMTKLIFDVFEVMDKTVGKRNVERYHLLFDPMTDKEFEKWFEEFFNSSMNFRHEFNQFKEETSIEDAMKAADIIGFPMIEPIVLNHLDGDFRTAYDCMILPLHINRLQQMVNKKNSMSIDISDRDPKTGQVVNHDKNGRVSDVENAALITVGLDTVAKEFLGPRADDLVAKTEMTNSIMTQGYVSLDSLTSDLRNKTALNTADAYMLASGLKSNLVTEGLETVRTLERKNRV